MGNSASSQKYSPHAVGPSSPHWAPQSRFNEDHSSSPPSSSPATLAPPSFNNPPRSPVSRIPVPLYEDRNGIERQNDSRKSLSGPIRNRPSNPTSHPTSSSQIRSRSNINPLPSSSTQNYSHRSTGAFDSSDPAGAVPPFIPSKVSSQPKQPPIFELEDESKSIFDSDHGHSPHTLPIPLAEALKHGLGKSADELDRQFREQEEEAKAQSRSKDQEQVETIQEEGSWMNQKGKKRETGETDRERLLAYWEQNEGTSTLGTSDLNPQTKAGFRRPRPHSLHSSRPTSSQTVMSFATGNSSSSGWSSEWVDTRGGIASNSRPVSSAYSYGAELSTPMEEEEEFQTPAERPSLDRFSFSQDDQQEGDSDTEVNGPSSSLPVQQLSVPPQLTSNNLLPPPQQSRNHPSKKSSDHLDSSRKQSKASLLSAAAASSTTDPELDAEQEEDGRSSNERRRRSLFAGLGERMSLDCDQDMKDQPEEVMSEEDGDEDRDRMEVEDTVGLALEGPPESNHHLANQMDSNTLFSERSNSLRSSRISNRTNMSSETTALHAAVETLRKGPSPMIDRLAIDELFERADGRDRMEGVVASDSKEEPKPLPQAQPPSSPAKRNRAASLMDRLRGRVRKGSDASILNPNSTPSSTSQEWSTAAAFNSPSSTDQFQNSPRSVSSSSFFNSRINRPRAQSAAQPINRPPFPFTSTTSPSQERRESDAMALDQDGMSEGISEQTAKPQRSSSVTRRALLRRNPSNSRMKKNLINQTSTLAAIASTSTPSPSSINRTLAHKRSATGSITNASIRSHSARSVRSKRSSGTSLRSSYRRENPNLSDSSNGNGDSKRTPRKSDAQNGNDLLKVSPPSLSLRRKGSPMPIRNSYLSEQRRPLPLPASVSNAAPTSSTNQINVESEPSAPIIFSKKAKPKLVRIGLGRRNSEAANAEPGGVWEDVENLDVGKKTNEGVTSSSVEASPLLNPTNGNRRWSGGWSWSKKSPNAPVIELPPPSQSSNEISEIRAVSPLAHIESHGVSSHSKQQSNDQSIGNSSAYRSPSSSFSSLAPPPTPALPPPPRKSNRRRTDSSSASLVETTSSAQQSPSEASFPNLALSSRKGSLPDSLPSQDQKRFSNSSNSNGNRNSFASSSSPHDRTASPSSPKQEISPTLNPMVSGLAAFAPSSPAAFNGIPLEEEIEENVQGKERSRGDSETVSDAGTKEILLSDEELIRASNSLDSEIESQSLSQLLTPKPSPSSQQRRQRNGLPIPSPALSPVKEASLHKTPSFASEIADNFSQDRPSLPHSISPSSSTVNLNKSATMVGPAPISPPLSSNSNVNNKFNPNSLVAQKSSSSFQKHAGEDASYSSSSPSISMRNLLTMHPQTRVRKPSQAESDVSLMSANGKVLDSISLASAPTASSSPGRRQGSQHSHSRSLSGGTNNIGGAEDRLSILLVGSQNVDPTSFSFGSDSHSLPRTPRRPLPAIPDQAPIQTRGSRSFSLPSSKAPSVPTNAELRAWKNLERDENVDFNKTTNQKQLQPRRTEQQRALKNSSRNHGSNLASELGLEDSKKFRQRTISAPTASVINSRLKTRESIDKNQNQNQTQDHNQNQSSVPFATSGVQASLAALAALETRVGSEEDEDPRAAWARERLLGIKDGSASVLSRLSVLNDNSSRRSGSEEISGSEIELRGSRDRRRVSPYLKSRRDGGRSSDGGYSSREDKRRFRSGFSNQSGRFHPKDFTGMATASSASLAEFEASQEESDGTTAGFGNSKRFNQKGNSRSIPPSFLVSPPLSNEKNEVVEVESSKLNNDWDEMIVPALRKRIEMEKQFEIEQINQDQKRYQQEKSNQMNFESINHQTSSSNLSSTVSPTLVSSVHHPTSSSGLMSSSGDSRITGVPFPRESFSSPKQSRNFSSESQRRNEDRRSPRQSDRNLDVDREDYYQERNRRKSETSRSHHHHHHRFQSSPKESRPKTSERRQNSEKHSNHDNKYGSLSSSYRSPTSFSNNNNNNSSNQPIFSNVSSTSKINDPNAFNSSTSSKRSMSHEISSNKNNRALNSSLNMSLKNGNVGNSSSRKGGKKPSKQGFSGEDILAWQSSISSGFVGQK